MSVVTVGLCASCVHHRIIENRRGSRFHMCERGLTDHRFAKYPPLPVHRCVGYEPVGPEAEATGGSGEEGAAGGEDGDERSP